ncbi:MAG: hypothetical protein ACT4P2_02650 [Pseudomonadota bacterium]
MIDIRTKRFLARLASAVLLLAPLAQAQASGHGAERLGEVKFPTSCSAEAQLPFDRAMALQHSFWYRAAHAAYSEVLKTDPSCAIAYWGIAMSLLYNPFSAPPAKNLGDGLATVDQGRAAGAKTERERDYLEAIAAFYGDHDKLDHRARVVAYLAAMERLGARYPDDIEASIFYALALNVAALPTDKTFANQLKAAAILEKIFAAQPNHPGVAHYLIHTYDYPALAPHGVAAAQRYAKIAPSAPHAQHMPSHIFTRLGHWDDSIASNIASAEAARAENEPGDRLHAMDYLVYAYLQTGRDRRARETLAEMNEATGIDPGRFGSFFALAAASARYAIERGAWSEAASLAVRPSRFLYVDAITHFANALGRARLKDSTAAREAIAKLAGSVGKLREAKDAYWAEQVAIQHEIASAWLAHAEGRFDDALDAMRAATDLEDGTDKHPVTPGPLAPARELLAEMLLERGMPALALAAFEAVLKKEPNRFRAVHGAAQAAERAGERETAKRHFAALVGLAASADTERPELVAARAYLARN